MMNKMTAFYMWQSRVRCFVAGTFQKVDYVILVGVGGGVPHYTDYQKHVRLGDVVVSHPADAKK